MAKLEVDIQAELVKAINKDCGGHSYKQSNRFLIGVVDLFVKHPDFAQLSLEVKTEVIMPGTKVITVDLTTLQKESIRKIRKAGGHAGWLYVGQYPRQPFYRVLIGTDTVGAHAKFTREEFDRDSIEIRQREKPWQTMIMMALEMLSVPVPRS